MREDRATLTPAGKDEDERSLAISANGQQRQQQPQPQQQQQQQRHQPPPPKLPINNTTGDLKEVTLKLKGQGSSPPRTAAGDEGGAVHFSQGNWVINPEYSRTLRRWDMTTFGCLIFVAVINPYEVAFYDDNNMSLEKLKKGADILFWVNRIIDIIFFTDMILQFFIMYPVKRQYGTVYIGSHRLIIKNYLGRMFWIDLVSILPYDIVGIFTESKELQRLKLIKIVRLLRLLKLARLFRGMRIIKRWEMEIDVQYRKIVLGVLFVLVMIIAHWMSCILGIVIKFQGTPCRDTAFGQSDCAITWITPAYDSMRQLDEQVTPMKSYLLALYVSATIIVHPHSSPPQNEEERIVFIILMFIGGFVWTKVISKSTALAASMDRHNLFFHQTMDDLNSITKDMKLTPQLRRRLRMFFMNTKDSSKRTCWKELTGRMSPKLRVEVSYAINRGWLLRVPYFVGISRFFVQELTVRLNSHNYSQEETFGSNFTLYIIYNGICTWFRSSAATKISTSRKSCILTAGCVWGEEHLLLNVWKLLIPNTAKSLGYSEVLSLTRENFWDVADDYPEYRQMLRKYYVHYVKVRGVLYEADLRRQKAEAAEAGSPKGVIAEDDEHRHMLRKTANQLRRDTSQKTFLLTFDESKEMSAKTTESKAPHQETESRRVIHDCFGNPVKDKVSHGNLDIEHVSLRLEQMDERLTSTQEKFDDFSMNVSQELASVRQTSEAVLAELALFREMMPRLVQQGLMTAPLSDEPPIPARPEVNNLGGCVAACAGPTHREKVNRV